VRVRAEDEKYGPFTLKTSGGHQQKKRGEVALRERG
jgi:hypothetical protein